MYMEGTSFEKVFEKLVDFDNVICQLKTGEALRGQYIYTPTLTGILIETKEEYIKIEEDAIAFIRFPKE